MSPLLDLSGSTALVTGAPRGIGRATAVRMAESGLRVVVSSRKQAACGEAAATERDHGAGRALPVAASISGKDALARMVDTVAERWGEINVLVCAAANPCHGPMAGAFATSQTFVIDGGYTVLGP